MLFYKQEFLPVTSEMKSKALKLFPENRLELGLARKYTILCL